MAKKGETAFVIVTVDDLEIQAVALSVSAAQDICRIFNDAGKVAEVRKFDINNYTHPASKAKTKWIDPDTLRKMMKTVKPL